MNNMAKKLNKADRRAFDTWFNRWVKKVEIEKHLMIAAQMGINETIAYDRDKVRDAYTRHRYEDPRFVERLQALLPDLDVVVDQHTYQVPISGTHQVYIIKIIWKTER